MRTSGAGEAGCLLPDLRDRGEASLSASPTPADPADAPWCSGVRTPSPGAGLGSGSATAGVRQGPAGARSSSSAACGRHVGEGESVFPIGALRRGHNSSPAQDGAGFGQSHPCRCPSRRSYTEKLLQWEDGRGKTIPGTPGEHPIRRRRRSTLHQWGSKSPRGGGRS